tara:strand:- start:1191 stop:1847 length:657 start_codon:yes stop_codon:yes gene_type:complete
MKKKIAIIGYSHKFIKILRELYPNSEIFIYHWRKIHKVQIKNNNSLIKADIIFICGYNYQSQWYSYREYYLSNITAPLKLVKFLTKKSTKILYANTLGKIKKNDLSIQRRTLSRYQFAKQELACKLYGRFKTLIILEIPVIKDSKNNANIYGGKITKIIFKLMIYLKLINTINNKGIKEMILYRINSKNLMSPKKLRPFFLKLPRSLLMDRILRFISD